MVLSARAFPPKSTIVDLVKRDPRLTLLRKLLKTTGMDMTLGSRGPYTLFAPTDAAFRKLPPKAMGAILSTDRLGSQIIGGHVLNGKYGTMSFTNGTSAPGQPLRHHVMSAFETHIRTVVAPNGEVVANGAKLVGEVFASNGTILVVDRVMPTIVDRPRSSGLSRTLPKELIEWGLGRYGKPEDR